MTTERPKLLAASELSDRPKGNSPSGGARKIKAVAAGKWEWEQAIKTRSRKEGMTPGCQHVALLLSTYADGDGSSIRPSVRTLTEVSGKSRASVHEALRYLRDKGWVEQVSRGAGATRRASTYRLTIPAETR